MLVIRSSCGLLLAAVAIAQAPPEPASVAGTVIHSITGAPILRAHIALRSMGPNPKVYGALTKTDGGFSIEGVAPGEYQATADRVGFFLPAERNGSRAVGLSLHAGDKKETRQKKSWVSSGSGSFPSE